MPELSLLSIVIPHRNRSRYLERCLHAIRHQRFLQDDYEIIVVDDHSDSAEEDAAAQIAAGYAARYLQNNADCPGAAGARNAGLAAVSSSWTLFLDSDCVAQPCLLQQLMEFDRSYEDVDLLPTTGNTIATQTQYFMVGPFTSDLDSVDCLWKQERLLADQRCKYVNASDGRFVDHPAPWVFAWTTGLLVATELARSVGGFDEKYRGKGSEDMVFGFNLSKAGASFRLLPIDPLIHLPHSRNRTAEESHDRQHERLFLRSHPCFDVEMLCAFDASNTAQAIRQLEPLCMRPVDQDWPRHVPDDFACGTGPVCLLGAANLQLRNWFEPDYCADPAFRNIEGPCKFSLIGLALPFEDRELSVIVIPDLRELLPETLICRVFQEAFRVAHRVIYLKKLRSSVPPLVDEEIIRIFDRPYWERIFHISRSYFDWEITVLAANDDVAVCEIHPAANGLSK